MSSMPELAANGFNVASILLAGRNNVHTWWTGIISCLLFGWVFFVARLYADVTLQTFFVITSVIGWVAWRTQSGGETLPIRRTTRPALITMTLAALIAALVYALLLRHFTDAYAPGWDSVVLTFSVLGQLLLMKRRLENWWAWLIVNTISVPLYASRQLNVTAALYAVFWLNALVSVRHWRRLLEAE